MNLNRTVIAPLSSAIIALMLAGGIVVGIDQIEPKLKQGEVRLSGKGLIEVSLGGERFVRSARTRILSADDRVRVLTGEAQLELPGGAEASLRAGSTVLVPAASGTSELVLQEGELLVDSKSREVSVEGGVALASVTGAAKLRRSESLAVGVYKGNVSLIKGDSFLGVHQYRQAAAAGTGILPVGELAPLSIDPADEWDQRMLPEVLELDDRLQKFGRQFEAAIPAGRDKDAALFGEVIPPLASVPLAGILNGSRAAGENVIGLTLVSLDSGSFDDRVANIFGFRAAGARWGLVAANRNLNPNPVMGEVEEALGRLNVALAPPGSTGGGSGGSSGGGRTQIGGSITNGSNGAGTGSTPSGSGPGGSTTPTTPSPGTPPTTPNNPGTPPGSPPSTPPPGKNQKRIDLPPVGLGLDPLLEPVVNPLENLLSGLLDGLLGPVEGTTAVAPTSTPTTAVAAVPASPTTTTTSGGLLGGVLNSVGGLLK